MRYQTIILITRHGGWQLNIMSFLTGFHRFPQIWFPKHIHTTQYNVQISVIKISELVTVHYRDSWENLIFCWSNLKDKVVNRSFTEGLSSVRQPNSRKIMRNRKPTVRRPFISNLVNFDGRFSAELSTSNNPFVTGFLSIIQLSFCLSRFYLAIRACFSVIACRYFCKTFQHDVAFIANIVSCISSIWSCYIANKNFVNKNRYIWKY